MNKVFDKRIVYLFIIIQPLLDLLTSYMSRNMETAISIGIIVRSAFLAYVSIYSLIIYKPTEKIYKCSKAILIAIICYIMMFLVNTVMTKGLSNITTEVIGIVKLFYMPIVLIGLFIFNDKHEIEISDKFLTYLLLGYTGIIFIATITGTYVRSYRNLYGPGSIGWFYAANETGAIIAMLLPFTLINFIKYKHTIMSYISIVLAIFSVVYMGTKVPFLGFIIAIGCIIINVIGSYIYSKVKSNKLLLNYKKISISILVSILMFGVLFYKSPIYRNIDLAYGHIIDKILNKNENENNNNVVSSKPEIPNENLIKVETKDNTKTEIKGSSDVDNELVKALLSKRDVFANLIKQRFNKGTLSEKLLGLGHVVEVQPGLNTNKTIEMDFLDVIYRQGIIGSIVYFAQLVLLLVVIIYNIIKKAKLLETLDVTASYASILLGLSIALLAGHVITAPAVSIYIIIPVIMLYNKTSKKQY